MAKQLIINQDKVLSKNSLLDLIENDTFDGDDASLKVHISNLNRKIKDYTGIKYIEAIWGIGYKLKDQAIGNKLKDKKVIKKVFYQK